MIQASISCKQENLGIESGLFFEYIRAGTYKLNANSDFALFLKEMGFQKYCTLLKVLCKKTIKIGTKFLFNENSFKFA